MYLYMMIHSRSSAVAAADCRTLRSLLGLNPSTFPIQNVNLKQAIRELYLVCSFRTGNSRSNYIFKTIPLCDFFLERNGLSMNLWETFDTRWKSIAENFCWFKQANELVYPNLDLMQKFQKKIWDKRTSALNFASVQISNFKHSKGLSDVYHDQMDDHVRRQRMIYWNRPKSCSASESLLWVLILDLSQRQPQSHFSWRVTWKGDFLTLGRDGQLDISWY